MKFINKIIHGDCLEVMKKIPVKSIDMILCDLPYGTTACKWDIIIPFEPLWKLYKRIIKDNGAIILFGNEPFSSLLRLSNLKMFKYDWVWVKSRPSGYLEAKNRPMKKHEIISVFSKGSSSNCCKNRIIYNPQGIKEINKERLKSVDSKIWGVRKSRLSGGKFIQTHTGYPNTILFFKSIYNKKNRILHPTQKPIALFKYLIKTYTNKGDLVLDNCAGSGTTAIACLKTKRNFILIEKEKEYYSIAKTRIENFLSK